MPRPVEAIEPENVSRVSQLAHWGNGNANAVALSADGHYLGVAASDGVFLYDLRTSMQVLVVRTPFAGHVFLSVAISPDGQMLAGGLDNGVADLWRIGDGSLLHQLNGEWAGPMDELAFSSDGETLSSLSSWSVGGNNSAQLWRVSDGALLNELRFESVSAGDNLLVTDMSLALDGQEISVVYETSRIEVRRLTDGSLVQALTLQDHPFRITASALSTDAHVLTIASQAGVSLWHADDGSILPSLQDFPNSWMQPQRPPDCWVEWVPSDYMPDAPVASLAIAPNADLLALALRSGGVQLRRISDGSVLHLLDGVATHLVFSGDGQVLALVLDSGVIEVWRVSDATRLATFSEHLNGLAAIALAPDGQALAITQSDQRLQVWHLFDRSLLYTFDVAPTSLALSDDRQLLAAGSRNGDIYVWQLRDGALLRKWAGHSADVTSLTFSPDGKGIASGARDCTIRIWRLGDGSLQKKLQLHGGMDAGQVFINSLAFSPDGQLLAGGEVGSSLYLWHDAAGYSAERIELGDGGVVTRITFAPKGNQVIPIRTSPRAAWRPSILTYSPDKRLVVFGGLLRVSDNALLSHVAEDASMADFSPDGRQLLSSSIDGSISLWGIRP